MSEDTPMPPELADVLRQQFEIDYADAGPKAPVASVAYKGVRLESRWGALRELNEMQRVVDALELSARRIESIWCDSNAGSTYTVAVRAGAWTPDLRWAITDAFKIATSGHNGIYVEAEGGGCTIDPDWNEDFLD